jgi:hypothetical protein
MKKIGSIFFLFLFCARAIASELIAPPTVVVTPNPVEESESVQLRIEVETELSTVLYQPTFDAPDFIVIGSGPQVYGNPPVTKYISGKERTTTKRVFEFVLSPKKAGALWIRNIQIKVGKENVKTSDLMVKVIEDGKGGNRTNRQQNIPPSPTPPTSLDEDESTNPAAPDYGRNSDSGPVDERTKFNSDFTVHAALSKRSAYVGEPIVIEYWLYDFGALQQIEVQKWPSFNGFWKEDLEITNQFRFESMLINNEYGRRAFISRYALYGLRPGKFRLDRLNIRGAYVSRAQSNGVFLSQSRRIGMHGSQDVEIEVLPLPETNRPKNFSGAVGDFQIKLEAEKTVLAQHSPVTFTLTLSGEGNFQSIENILIPLPPGFEVYDSKTGAKGTTPMGMRRELFSQKVFQVTAIPRTAGKFTIPAIEWNFFHPKKKAYELVATAPLELEVTESAAGATPNNQYLTAGQGPGSPEGQSSRSLITNPEFYRKVPLKKVFGFALALLFVLNLYLFVRWYRLKASGIVLDFLKDPLAEAKAEWQKGKDTKDIQWTNFFEESLYSAGEALLGSNPRGITRSDFEDLWREKKLPAPLFHQISLVLDQLDQLRFTGKKSAGDLEKIKSKLAKQIEEIFAAAKKSF